MAAELAAPLAANTFGKRVCVCLGAVVDGLFSSLAMGWTPFRGGLDDVAAADALSLRLAG